MGPPRASFIRVRCNEQLSKLLSPAAEAFRYFMLERGERFLAAEFSPVPENAAP